MSVTVPISVRRAVRTAAATMAVTVVLATAAGAQGSGQELAAERRSVPASFSSAGMTVPPSALPGNLRFAQHLRPVLEAMWRGSPSFRRQCARLGEAPHMTVVLNTRMSGARTRLDHPEGRREASAIVWLDLVNLHESIPHELEHVLESIDGVDVRVSSARSMRGVTRLGSSFETARAREIGATVARELRSVAHTAR